jgi:tol-pal system protein YbgF
MIPVSLRILAVGALLATAVPAVAQDGTLADIRQELSTLYIDIQSLRAELTATGALTTGPVGNTPLERLNAIESELQRLTSKTEELEFRINRITTDGTNRIGDLEFRICELEPGCDIGALGSTPSLGGVDSAAAVPAPQTPTEGGGPALAIGEGEDFRRAQEALAAGDFRGAADLFATVVTSYPGSPLTAEAHLRRGDALTALGASSDAARAYLDSFSFNPTGAFAPEALVKLGTTLGGLGQVQDACVTLAEVGLRFPGTPQVAQADAQRAALACF